MYPEAKMIQAMKIWKLPKEKEDMFAALCDSGEYFATEKIDGYLYMFERTENYKYLFSRTISKKTGYLSEKGDNVPHIMGALDCLPPGTILVGEIYYPGKTSKDVTTIMGCLPQLAVKRQENNPIHYYIHDILAYNGEDLLSTPALERYEKLALIWERYQLDEYPFLRLAQKVEDNIVEYTAVILSQGGEGVVLKKNTAPYTPDKRPAWDTIKVKQMDTIDLICVGVCEPTKEYTGKEYASWEFWENINTGEKTNENHCIEKDWIAITKPYYYSWKTAMEIGAYDDNGEIVKLGTVSSGLTDEDRQEMATHPEKYLNNVFEFSCMSIDKKEHTLRHPRLIKRREDKNPSDCKISEIF